MLNYCCVDIILLATKVLALSEDGVRPSVRLSHARSSKTIHFQATVTTEH